MIKCCSLLSVEDDGKNTRLRVQEMSLRALDQEFEELSYACSVNMDKLFNSFGISLA